MKESEDSEIYGCIQDLRDRKEDLAVTLEQLERGGRDETMIRKVQQEIQNTEEIIIAKNEERRQRK